MTTMLRRVQRLLDSGDSDNAREEIDRAFGNLRKVDSHVREFAALLALGPIKASEIGLGVLGRKLLQNDSEINNEVVWLFILNVGVKTLSFTDGMKPDQYRTAKHH
jgi:hypothetical protein